LLLLLVYLIVIVLLGSEPVASLYVTVERSGAKPPELPRFSVLSLLGKSPDKCFWLFSSSPDAFSFFSDLISCSFATMLLSVPIVEAA
jgi:hypothetical protein